MKGMSHITKILIVDDSQSIRDLLEITFNMEKYQLVKVKNAVECLATVVWFNPEIIIMDVMMPGEMNGLDATKILKSSEDTQKIKIILLTGKGRKEDVEEGIKVGADYFFVKPFSPLELLKKVESIT